MAHADEVMVEHVDAELLAARPSEEERTIFR
jgi:hypothetical protein